MLGSERAGGGQAAAPRRERVELPHHRRQGRQDRRPRPAGQGRRLVDRID